MEKNQKHSNALFDVHIEDTYAIREKLQIASGIRVM